MAEYIYPKQSNVLGWSVTFNPTDKMPVIGSRIWTTLADLQAYLNDATSSAIAGIQVAVVADPVSDNNGTYEIVFDSLERLVSGANYVGIKGGKATGTYATLADAENARDVTHEIDSFNPNVAVTYDDNGVTKSNLTYRKLANAGEVGTDSVVTYNATTGTLNATTGAFNDAAVQVIQGYIDTHTPTISDSVVTYNSVAGTLNATTGLFNDAAVGVIKEYVDDFDCGSFTI